MNYYRELYLFENTEDRTFHFIYGSTVECEAEEQNKAVQKISLKNKSGKTVFNLLIKKDVRQECEQYNHLVTLFPE